MFSLNDRCFAGSGIALCRASAHRLQVLTYPESLK